MININDVRTLVTYYGKGVTPKYVEESSIIVLNQKCIRNNRIDYSLAQFIDDSKIYNEVKFLKIGDVLINSTGQGTAGRVAIVDFIPNQKKVIPDSHILVLRTHNYLLSKCLNYSLFSMQKTLQTYIDGSTGQGEFDRERLFNIKLSFPSSSDTQRHAVQLLSSIDTKIILNNEINDNLSYNLLNCYLSVHQHW